MNEYKCWMCDKMVPETQMSMYDLCPSCQPKLDRDISEGLFQETEPCKECGGRGQIEWPPYSERFFDCHNCDSTGIVEVQP